MLYKIDHRDRTIDSDGDGLTDYQEMLFGTDPWIPNPPPRDPTAVEIAQFERNAAAQRVAAQKEWEAKLAEAAPRMVELIPLDKSASEAVERSAGAEFDALRQQAAQSLLDQPAKERALDEIAAKYGVPREMPKPGGGKLILSGEFAGAPVWISSQNAVAASSVGADRLWPLTNAPFFVQTNQNTGLNLTGAGQTLALWEVDGGVRTNHLEFDGRVFQKDGAALDARGHATAVTGTMAAGGVGSIFTYYYESQGVALGTKVFGYDLNSFKPEREAAAAGDVTNAPVFVSNHSWGQTAGWSSNSIVVNGTNIPNAWIWNGLTNSILMEDYQFGFYTPDFPNAQGCTNIDRFLYSEAPRHLMVFAAGNNRSNGPGTNPNPYYVRSGTNYVAMSLTRDWIDGDDGGYDSLLAPGTAKNVLTVGACEDVFYTNASSSIVFGFGPGANAVAAPFSGAGPTDDGRIKPDLAAVGTTNATLRGLLAPYTGGQALGLFSPTAGADTTSYNVWSGTSFAAPAVSGGLGLVLQRYAQLYGTLSTNNAWPNSTLKAIAIDTADDVGAPGPDYRFGYGIFNALNAVLRVNADYNFGRGSLIKEFTLTPSNSVSWVVVSDGTAPLCVTAAWSDPPGPALTSITNADDYKLMLINDLDLSVKHLDTGTNYLPWVLNPDITNKTAATRSAAATRGVDNRNNVEQVSLTNPPAGRYLVTVKHSGGVPGNPAPTNQLVSVTLGGTLPEMAAVTSLVYSPSSNQTLLTFRTDPGAYYRIQISTNLISGWIDDGLIFTTSDVNSVLLTNAVGETNRFWRFRRGQ